MNTCQRRGDSKSGENSTSVRFIASPLNTSDPRDAARALPKGRQTRAAILEAALGLASHMGLEGLSIGALAEITEMSKSGVFAHFGSRSAGAKTSSSNRV